jgi:hypothetical protein
MSAVSHASDCVSDFAIDRLLSASDEPAERARAEDHLAGCVRCTVRRESLAKQRAGYLERVPSWQALHARHSAASTASISRARISRRLGWGLGGGAMLAAVGAALLLVRAPSSAPAPEAGAPALRSKGGPSLGAYVKHGDSVTRAEDGSTVIAGDYVRFTYSSDRPVHFGLLNRDGKQVTAYYPLGAQTVEVAAGKDVALDFSIKLDAEPGREQAFAVFCDRPQALEPLRAALTQTGSLPELPHCQVSVLTLHKKAR